MYALYQISNTFHVFIELAKNLDMAIK